MVLLPCFGSLIFKPFLFTVESLNFSSMLGVGRSWVVKREDRTTVTDEGSTSTSDTTGVNRRLGKRLLNE